MNTLITRRSPATRRATHATHAAPPVSRLSRPASYLGLGLASGHDAQGAINRLSGLRNGRMVEIRFPVGDAESATWLLCRSPRFDTVLGRVGSIPGEIAAAIGDVPVCVPIWQGLHLIGGELGLVAVRAAESPMPHGFLHDLWLLERIAANLQLLPIPAGNLQHEPIPGVVPAPQSVRAHSAAQVRSLV